MLSDEYECPECDEILTEESIVHRLDPENKVRVWICKNEDCINYDKVVYDMGDITE